MKKDIHPQYYPQATVTCTCGNTFTVGSTKQELQVEICSACHPFFTGEMKYVDTAGRVDKFLAKQKAATGKKVVKKKEKRRLKEQSRREAEARAPKTLREMMQRVRKDQKAQKAKASTVKSDASAKQQKPLQATSATDDTANSQNASQGDSKKEEEQEKKQEGEAALRGQGEMGTRRGKSEEA